MYIAQFHLVMLVVEYKTEVKAVVHCQSGTMYFSFLGLLMVIEQKAHNGPLGINFRKKHQKFPLKWFLEILVVDVFLMELGALENKFCKRCELLSSYCCSIIKANLMPQRKKGHHSHTK